MNILWRVFHILTKPVPYTFVSVNRPYYQARAHIAMWLWARAALFRRLLDLRIETYMQMSCGGGYAGRCDSLFRFLVSKMFR